MTTWNAARAKAKDLLERQLRANGITPLGGPVEEHAIFLLAKAIQVAPADLWQDMATAPKTGDFLAYIAHGYVTRGRLISGKFFACDSAGVQHAGDDTTPTHWMPVPAGPAATVTQNTDDEIAGGNSHP